jgi:ParB-like chromosome segregation protein Spo0J
MNTEKITVQYKNLSEIEPYNQNARSHSINQIRQIANSIEEFGFTNPILIDGNKGVIAGHGRLYAAKLLEMKQVPCVELSHLTEDQKRAYVIADNQIALNADWDFEILKEELEALKHSDFDITLTGVGDLDDINHDENHKPVSDDTSPQEIEAKFSVMVDCEDEADQEAVFKLMMSKGYKCKVMSI